MNTPDLTTVGAKAWNEARRYLAVIRRLAEDDCRTRAKTVAAARELGCGPTRVYALLRQYLLDPRLTSLLPQPRGRKVGTTLLDPAVEALIEATIDDVYLTRQRVRLVELTDEVRRGCVAGGLAPPSRKAITARLRARKAGDVLGKREGRKAARDRYAPVKGALSSEYPLALVQIDHTLVDVIVVDSETRAPIQRPWLTVAIDVNSRCIAGFHLSLEPPSATSVALCLTHAVLPKTNWLAESGINGAWPVRGVPERLHLDNAKEFRSEALKRGCEQYGIAIDYRPVRTPHYGGHIERLIGTMMGKVHLLPGTTFSNVAEKGDINPDKTAAMTIYEVERWLGHAIAGVYHRQLHRGIGMPPIEAWSRGIAGHGDELGRGEPATVADPRRFLIDFLPIERRLVRRDGVRLHSIAYWADVLSTWIGEPTPMIVRYDPRDLSRIYLLGPDDTYYDVAYRDLRRPPISLWEHRLVLKRLREEGRALIDEAAIFNAVDAMRAIADDAVRTSKRARRQRERRFQVIQGGQSEAARIGENAQEDDGTFDEADMLQPHERMLPVEEWS
ncbi:putative transposase [Bradyrhizobium macuxiense]|uniref:Putative transposase n=1 Tax=Bradyrhizobium macuxiense TaxID=1755647 RepID=A0A560KU92_9BRAD|nr:Mu transposase C-terminal domain-containing protein [Bradyrhizobium macuxiense]TWB86828.1 putative transposase [Bradyrhizobium macuxiense]